MKTALIIGGGFAGCTSAHMLGLMGGWDVTVVEANPFLGAGVRTNFYGGHPYTFGPRHFLTQNVKVFEFLNKYLPLRRCADHQFLTYVASDSNFYNYPIHRDDIPRMPDREQIEKDLKGIGGFENAQNFEEFWISSVGKTLYEKMINGYTKKMWRLRSNKELDTFNWSPKGVTLKEGPREAWDTAISAYPEAMDGYNAYFDIATEKARVLLSTRVQKYDIPNRTVVLNDERKTYDIIINTISPDEIFYYEYGELGYIGRDFHKIVLPIEHAFPANVYFLYYAGDEEFTRIVEYKKFYKHNSPSTLLGLEIPSSNGKHYPIPITSELSRAKKYFSSMPDGVFSIGRQGSYRYDVDIDDTIAQAMDVMEKIK